MPKDKTPWGIAENKEGTVWWNRFAFEANTVLGTVLVPSRSWKDSAQQHRSEGTGDFPKGTAGLA